MFLFLIDNHSHVYFSPATSGGGSNLSKEHVLILSAGVSAIDMNFYFIYSPNNK